MPKGQKPAAKKPEKDFGEKIRAKMDSMRGPTERMGKRVQEAFPAISNKFKEKAAADAAKSKSYSKKPMAPAPKPKPAAKKPNPNSAKKMGPTGESPAYLEKMKQKKTPAKKKMM